MIPFKSFQFGKAEAAILSAFVFLILLGIGVATIPSVATWYETLTTTWTQLVLHYGYWGAFLAALVGSLTIVIIFPYTIVFIFLAAQGLNPIYLGFLMGLGATIGEMSGYLIGLTGSRFVERKKPETFDALQGIVAHRPRMIQWLLFLFAMTPLPDDVLFIPLGILRYPWWKIIPPTLTGKIITGMYVTTFGYLFKHAFDTKVAGPATAVASQLVTFAAIAIVVYVFFKLDWPKMAHRLIKSNAASEAQSKKA